jgi:hypothetical protein
MTFGDIVQAVIDYGAPILYVQDFAINIFTCILELIAFSPNSLVTSPLTSYLDQILSIHRNRSSAGFSLDIPLIMLVASILK